MAVSMGLRNKATGEHREVPIATLATFNEVWLPLCERLELVWVPEFAGGALTRVPEHLIPHIVGELSTLAEMVVTTGQGWIAERISNILTAFVETSPVEWEYAFG